MTSLIGIPYGTFRGRVRVGVEAGARVSAIRVEARARVSAVRHLDMRGVVNYIRKVSALVSDSEEHRVVA